VTREAYIAVDDEHPLTEGPWLMLAFLGDNHVMFEADQTKHELDRGCWCRPILDPVGAAAIVIHERHYAAKA
jgi:hypothetical protein